MTSPSGQSNAGVGKVALASDGSSVSFSELSSAYPLKLLSPRTAHPNVAVLYIMSYGGGLIGGDRIQLSMDLQPGCTLMALTQGSTKVFKSRAGLRQSILQPGNISAENEPTSQTLEVTIHPNSSLFLLPDPVTCFRDAAYNQVQKFRLSGSSSAIILDWITSGRQSLGEDWAFARYYSLIEVFVDGKRIARDAMLLERQSEDTAPLPPRTLANKLAPYSCYATLLMHGPLVQDSIRNIRAQYEQITVFKRSRPDDLIWSMSPIDLGGAVIRVAGKGTEDVKQWLKFALQGVEPLVGTDAYRRVFV